ncbi:MAG: hypothetical protein IJX63_01810 [Lachnospiraceae bacterium]|nr:hypothetical protein [Lachnospiraceae bacterium]
MIDVMYKLANLCGFDYMPETFPELFTWVFLALCGTAILCSIIKVMFYLTVNAKGAAKWLD